MPNTETSNLSELGLELLSNPVLFTILSVIAEDAGVTAEEYLLRFEDALLNNTQELLHILEGSNLSL